MFTSIIAFLAGIPTAIGNGFKYFIDRQALNNTPEMKNNLQAKRDEEERVKDIEAIKKAEGGDLDELRKRSSF